MLFALAEVQGRKRRGYFRWSTFQLDAARGADRCGRLDINFLAKALCLIGISGHCSRATAGDIGHRLEKPNVPQTAVLLFGHHRGGCSLAAPLKSLSIGARQGTTLYSEVKIDRIAILGAGGWGTALSWLWGKDGRQICLWSHNVDRAARLQKTRENSDYLPRVTLPSSVRITSELRDCAGADLIVFVTPSTALREIATHLRKVVGNARAILLSCTKGIEHSTGMRMSQILSEVLPERTIAVLSGPNLAVEIAQGLPTATVVGLDYINCAASLQGNLGSPHFRIYTSQDVASIELGGALKNVFALAAGMSDGLGLGDNSKAALVTRSLAELARLGVAMGGNANAFFGLSGAGDLILTCYSERSRNHTVGKRLGRGEPLDQIVTSMRTVAEGIPTTRSAWEGAQRLDIATPIIDQVHSVLYEQKKPTVALEELLKREPKPE